LRFLEADFGNIYPRENAELIKRIIDEGGAVLTEYEINEKPLPINFPRRNRIISGLSQGVIVTEASQKSGSLITADLALEQGKEVFAVPRKCKCIYIKRNKYVNQTRSKISRKYI
jgi:DNA processing protein